MSVQKLANSPKMDMLHYKFITNYFGAQTMSYTRTLCQSVCLQSKHLGTDDITFISDREKTGRKKISKVHDV